MSEEFYEEMDYRSKLDAEGLLLMHMNRIAINRDTDIKRYCSSVETFMLICPRHVRDKILSKMRDMGLQRGRYGSITDEKLVMYDDLLIFINEQLEKQKMIWRTKDIKTYS